MRFAYLVGLSFCLWLGVGASSVAQVDKRAAFEQAFEEATQAVGKPAFDAKVTALLAFFPQTPDGYYIVDGDMVMTDYEVREMVRDRHKAENGEQPWPESARQGELIVMTLGGVPTCYRTGSDRRLTYAIDKNSFAASPDANAYDKIRQELAVAMKEWQDVCPECKLEFVYHSATAPAEGEANFIVKYMGDQGSLVARAFFPKDIAAKRYLWITKAYYTAGYNKIGVLRHELGHVLGYRHEHIRPEAPVKCYFDSEDSNWKRIDNGSYDAKSVMHYPCKISDQLVAGTYKFELTTADRASHKKFYTETCKP